MGLYRRAFLFSTGERYATILLNFALIAAISRVLTPDEIGVSVIGTTIMAFAESVRDSPSSYLVQKQALTRADARTGFTIMLLISLLIAATLIGLAGWLARVLGQKELVPFLWLIAACLLPACVERPIMALLRRDLQFATYAFINVTATLTTVAVTVALALLDFSYMCFAWGLLAGTLVSATLALSVRPYFWMLRPLLSEWRTVLPFNAYGGANGLLSAVYDMVPYAILGRSAQFDAVGYFNRSITLCRLPDKLNAGIISLALPAFSTVVREAGDLSKAYLRAIELLTVVEWPLRVMLVLFAYPIVHVILGPQWIMIVPLVQIMSLAFLLSTPQLLTYPILVAAGGVRDTFRINLICVPLAAIIMSLSAYYGLQAMALVMFFIAPLQTCVALIYIRRRAAFLWRDLLSALKRSGIATAFSAIGPIAVILITHSRPEPSISLSFGMVSLAAIGWLVGIRMTRHPICWEIEHVCSILLSRTQPWRRDSAGTR